MVIPRRAWSLFAIALLAAGCRATVPRRGGTVILASGADLQSANPLVTTHPLAKQVQRYVLLTTLVRYDTALRVTPYLARTWAWSADSTVLTFTLHHGVRWHDGQPTTAYDAAYTYAAALDPATGYPRRPDLAHVADIRATDDTTVVIRFDRPEPGIPDVFTDLAILPVHLLAGVPNGRLREAAWNARPVGNGPFRFVRHEANRRWVFEANPGFPPTLGRAGFDRLVVAVVDEPTTKLASLAAGELDFAGIQPAHAEFVRRDPALAVLDYPLLYSYAVVFNTRRGPFRDRDARRAVNFAVDRLEIVSGYLFGFGSPASGPLPPELTGKPAMPFFAPGRGRALLGDRKLGFELLTVGSGEAAMEQLIQRQLARIGITVTIRQLELGAFLDRVYRAHDFDAAVVGLSGDLGLGYLRTLLDLAGTGAAGSGAALLPVFTDSVPAAFLYHARGLQGMNRRLTGVRMDLRGELAGVLDWRVSR